MKQTECAQTVWNTRQSVGLESAADASKFFSLVVRRRLDDVRVVDLYVRLTRTLDREQLGDFLVS